MRRFFLQETARPFFAMKSPNTQLFVFFAIHCVLLLHGRIRCAQIVATGLLEAEDFDCPTGTKLKENGCNGCFCTDAGELACTLHECPENRGLENCTLRTSWQRGCNKCWCITIGTVCTDREC